MRNLREELSDLCHKQWSGWMDYEFSKGTFNEDGSWTMPAEFVKRWQRQADTPYAELSESEQDSDRNEADKFLALLKANLLDGQYINAIIAKSTQLKQSDGEGWAIGNFIQKILE